MKAVVPNSRVVDRADKNIRRDRQRYSVVSVVLVAMHGKILNSRDASDGRTFAREPHLPNPNSRRGATRTVEKNTKV